MKTLTKTAFNEIRAWVYRNARPVDLALWQFNFENGGKNAVLQTLAAYQNDDGGFGHALEADCWNLNSSPYTTLHAIDILEEIGFDDTAHPIFKGIFRFLESGAHSFDNGWLFNIPTNDAYPRAPWWTFNPDANEYESIGVTLGIAGFLLKYADKDSALYRKALGLARMWAEKLCEVSNIGDMGVGGIQKLRRRIMELGLEDKFDMPAINKMVREKVDAAIERDPSKWAYYCSPPSQFISSPADEFYAGNEDITQQELDFIIDSRNADGVWDITWSWFDLNEKYAKEFAVSENWWKAVIARSKIRQLLNFGRAEA